MLTAALSAAVSLSAGIDAFLPDDGRMTVRVVTAGQSAARDSAAIESGVPSRAMMQRAGVAAAAELVRHFGDRLERGVAVFAGVGNNGGDAWVVAGALAAVGIRVRVEEVRDAKTDDARAERAIAKGILDNDRPMGAEGVIVDGILGTGFTGAPRGPAEEAIRRICSLRTSGARIVALDVPSGLDASTGDAELAVTADLTVAFGTIKRGALVRRDLCGHIIAVDIGLGAHVDDDAPTLVDRPWVANRVPRIAANAHKGTRRRIAVIGGAQGMAGASILAARAALRSGAGMVRVIVHPASVGPVQAAVPAALTRAWPESDEDINDSICEWAHAVVIGPGLGLASDTRARIERILSAWRGPVILDADALTVYARDAAALGHVIGERRAVITPHVVEFSRLSGLDETEVRRNPFEVGRALATQTRCVVLLKGVPTVLTAHDGRSLVSAAGTPALATGGSGDALAGIAATLIAQMDDPLDAAACAAWVHGRAGELAGARGARGVNLDDVVNAIGDVWSEPIPPPRPPVLTELPAIPDDSRGDSR